MGVNDITQIKNESLKRDSEFVDTIVKVRMNSGLGQQKVEKAKDIINKSHIICIFGMSLGNTDKIWWEELVTWLMTNANNKLLIFWKDSEEILKKKLPSKLIRLNNQMKKMIFEKGKGKYGEDAFEKIQNRIMVSYNANIFNFPKLINKS